MIPFAAAGSGKSYFWNIIQEQLGRDPKWSLQSVSSDDIRGQLIEQHMATHNTNRDKAF